MVVSDEEERLRLDEWILSENEKDLKIGNWLGEAGYIQRRREPQPLGRIAREWGDPCHVCACNDFKGVIGVPCFYDACVPRCASACGGRSMSIF